MGKTQRKKREFSSPNPSLGHFKPGENPSGGAGEAAATARPEIREFPLSRIKTSLEKGKRGPGFGGFGKERKGKKFPDFKSKTREKKIPRGKIPGKGAPNPSQSEFVSFFPFFF